MAAAGNKQSKAERNLLMSLAISNLNMARVFVEGARSAFNTTRADEAEFARLRAIKFFCEALSSVLQMPASDQELLSSDLQYLRTQIEWLLMQSGASHSPFVIQEEASMKKLLQLLEEKG